MTIAGVKGGPFGAVSFLVVWTAGMGLSAWLLRLVGRPRTGDLFPTITGDNDFDFALVSIWPLGLPVILACAFVKKLNR